MSAIIADPSELEKINPGFACRIYNVEPVTNSYCSGTLITPRHVLTAAHCLQGFPSSQAEEASRVDGARNVRVKCGSSREGRDDGVGLTEAIPHPGYFSRQPSRMKTSKGGLPDLMLLTLKEDVGNPVSLPFTSKDLQDLLPSFSECRVSGWGALKGLRTIAVKLSSTQLTSQMTEMEFIQFKRTNRAEDASYQAILDFGDSGGPLYCRVDSLNPWILVGTNVISACKDFESCGDDETHLLRDFASGQMLTGWNWLNGYLATYFEQIEQKSNGRSGNR